MSRSLLHDDPTVLKAFLYVFEQNLALKAQKTEIPCADAWLRNGGADGWGYTWYPPRFRVATGPLVQLVECVSPITPSRGDLRWGPGFEPQAALPFWNHVPQMSKTLRSLWVSLTIYFFYPIACVNPCKELLTRQSYTFCLFTPSLKREKSKQIAILKKARLNYRYRS